MLLRKDILAEIAAKRVSLAFRRWRKPSVKPGGTLMTTAGLLVIDAVDRIAMTKITDADLKRAGYRSRAALLRELAKHPGGDCYRIAFHLKGADPRIPLRQDGRLTKAEMKSALASLKALDQASEHGAWTTATLRLIDKYPARRAPDLAASQRRDPLAFKRDVRKLKDLGLTEALEIGYRLSLRGRAVLEEIGGPMPSPAPSPMIRPRILEPVAFR